MNEERVQMADPNLLTIQTEFQKVHGKTNRTDLFPELLASGKEGGCLILAPHPDDEIIGCGGTLHRLVQAGVECKVIFMTQTKDAPRAQEARQALARIGIEQLEFLGFRDGMLAAEPELNASLSAILSKDDVGLLCIPGIFEVHPDHYTTTLLTNQLIQKLGLELSILCYEIWSPVMNNGVVPLTPGQYQVKLEALAAYPSQLGKYSLLKLAQLIGKARQAEDGTDCEAFYLCQPQQLNRLVKRFSKIRGTI